MAKQYYYSTITELVVPETVSYNEMHSAINKFIDTLPHIAEELSDNITREEYNELAETLTKYMPRICKIYAKLLEGDARLIIRRIERTGHPSLLIGTFLANLMSLSIKIQKAQSFGDEIEHIETVKAHVEIAHTMTLFIDLIDDGDYSEAHGILSDMNIFDEETAFIFDRLLTMIITKDYVQARHLANDLKDTHMKAMQQVVTSGATLKILAVDDIPESLSFISKILQNHFKVFRVTNAKTALKVIGTQKIDLFILDIEMPEINGYELAETIRATSGYAKTPIIFLTSNSQREHVEKAKKVGANDFIIKPATYEALMTSVNKYISN